MIHRLCALALLLAGAALAAAPRQANPPADGPQVIRPAKQAAKPAPRALAWSLLIDPLDQTPGNAAQVWLRASLASRGVRHMWTAEEEGWHSVETTPLDKIPQKELQALLKKHDGALEMAGRAALCNRCDWGYPPLTIQSLGDVALGDVQMVRELIKLVSLRCRLALAQGRFDDAARDLRIGFTLTRQLGDSQLMIQDLVGLAIGGITLSRVEEWIQIPGSPNLYWALTELPRPLLDVRGSIRSEVNTLYRSYPALRDLKAKKLSAEEAKALVERFFVTMCRLADEPGPDWKLKLGLTVFAMKYYPTAKKELLARGRSEKEVDALPAIQAVALYMLEEYDRVRDEFVRCTTLPAWQGFPEMEKVVRAEMPKARENGNLPIALLMPAMEKVSVAQLRVDRNIAGLRAAEAIRLYVAKHGAPPLKLADITEVPLPTDPITGKGFDDWYSRKGNMAVLDVPPSPGMPARLGKRYEFPLQAR
jgi:hypothetical protein